MDSLRSFGLIPLLLLAAACGDDDQPSATGQGGQGAGDVGGQGGIGQGGSGAEGGSGGGGASGGAGGGTCGEGVGHADLDGGAWDARFTLAGVSGQYGVAPMIHDFARDIDGSLLAAGAFDSYEGATVAPLLRWTGAAWEPARTTWELPPPGAGFSAVAVSPTGTLALATNDHFGEKTGEIWIDDGAGLVSIGAFDGRVRRVAFFDGKLWVAGLFAIDDGGGSPVEGLAVWDGTTWSAPPGGAAVGPVFELVVDGDALLVGGAFDQVGGVMAASVASYDGAIWTPYDFDGALSIYALARTAGGDLYAGGAFGDFGAASGVARWDGTAWQIVGGGVGQYQTRGVVTDLAFHDGVLDVTGCFNSAGGLDGAPGAIDSQSVARWDGASWQSLDDGTQGAVTPWFAPFVCGDEGLTAVWDVSYQALAGDGQGVVAGGAFGGIGGVQSQSLIAHDGAAWVAQGEAGLGIGGSIDTIAAGGPECSVYGVGTFTHVAGSQKVGRVVHFDGAAWENLSDALPNDAWCPAVDVSETGEVAVGCMVFPPAGDAEGVVLRRDGDAMVAMDTAELGPVMALAWSPSGTLWVGGMGTTTGYLARIDGTTVEIVEEGFDGPIQQIDIAADDDIVVAGAFTQIASLPAARIARWNGASWFALGDGLPASATALARDGETIYASTYDEGSGAYLLGAFDGTSWQELATSGAGLTPQSHFNFNALRVVDGAVIAAGSAELDDGSGRGALVYREGTFTALGGGVSAINVGGVAVTADAVWIAGSITAAGPEDDATSSVGIARFDLAP